jgi:hypothetical protein
VAVPSAVVEIEMSTSRERTRLMDEPMELLQILQVVRERSAAMTSARTAATAAALTATLASGSPPRPGWSRSGTPGSINSPIRMGRRSGSGQPTLPRCAGPRSVPGPVSVRELAGQGTTVLLTTQYLDEAEQLAASRRLIG